MANDIQVFTPSGAKDLDVDRIQGIIDSIPDRIKSGDFVEIKWRPKTATNTTAVKSANSSLITYGLLALMAFIFLKPSKPAKQ